MSGLSGKGSRRRTEMWMIQGADARQVAFSKRRSGLFKKASELCTLCAVETALVVFSPNGKAFSFCPNCRRPDLDAIRRAEAEKETTLHQLNKKHSDLLEKLEAEKIRGERLKQMRMESLSQGQSLVDRPVNELNLQELLTLKSQMEELKEKLRKRKQELSVKPAASTSTSAGASNASADTHDHDVGHEH
ncbi:hypothetical protein REPUB_Repub09cG0145700 [Reevesia pubescens]